MDALVATKNTDVLFVAQAPNSSEAPFDVEKLSHSYRSEYLDPSDDYDQLIVAIDSFNPDIILAGGSWRIKPYRTLLRNFKGRSNRVFCSDTQWHGNMRQWLVVAIMRLARSKLYDQAFVAGERQLKYVRQLGFKPADIQSGLYSCDHSSFSSASDCSGNGRFENPSFLFVGRLVDIKGIAELLDGYAIYRDQTENPWPLDICGTGPLEELVENAEGVQYRGFVQPEDLPNIMASHTTLLVPSHIEPWPLVIHEAVSAGMSVICSSACGAGDAYVENNKNGEILESVSSDAISNSLLNISRSTADELMVMSNESSKRAATMTPSIWADKVLAFSKG